LAVAIGADDVALRNFGKDRLRPCASDHLAHHVFLLARVTMIELHDEEWERPPAVEARDCPQGCKKLGLCRPVRGLSCEVARHSLRS
jgi:hypothetical protein